MFIINSQTVYIPLLHVLALIVSWFCACFRVVQHRIHWWRPLLPDTWWRAGMCHCCPPPNRSCAVVFPSVRLSEAIPQKWVVGISSYTLVSGRAWYHVAAHVYHVVHEFSKGNNVIENDMMPCPMVWEWCPSFSKSLYRLQYNLRLCYPLGCVYLHPTLIDLG